MNINDLNNSGPSSADQTASMSAAAAYAAAQGDAAAARQIASGQWSTKRMQEEFDHAKAGLVHKDFKPSKFLESRKRSWPCLRVPVLIPGPDSRLS